MANFKTELAATLANLIALRETWETGSYKKATDELYAILDQCGAIYASVREDKENARALNAVAETLSVAFNKGTSAALKVVRIVFGKQGDREFAYARVLKVWFEERSEDQSVTNFLIERGGIESVRRASKTQSTTLTPDDYRDIAATALVDCTALTTLNIADAMITDDKNDTGYVVALVRNNNGVGEVLYATNKSALVNAALAVTGKELDELQKREASHTKMTDVRDATLDNVKQFIVRQRQKVQAQTAA